MIFDVINPCDPYTMEAPDIEVAAVAIVVVGEGQYALHQLDGDKMVYVPLFIKDGDHEAWFQLNLKDNFTAIMDRVVKQRTQELIDCLDSFTYGDIGERALFKKEAATYTDRDAFLAFRKKYHDTRRGSQNDIAGRAWEMADIAREQYLPKTPSTIH